MTQARDLANEANSAPGFSPAGTIITFGGTTAPAGYLACDGSAVSRTLYANLFAAIGTTWGVTTPFHFNVPDLRGAFLRGTGSHGTSNMADGNAFAGPSVGSFEDDQAQSHGHAIKLHSTGSGGISLGSLSAVTNKSGQVTTMEESSAGPSRDGDETRPFNAGVLYCIKT